MTVGAAAKCRKTSRPRSGRGGWRSATMRNSAAVEACEDELVAVIAKNAREEIRVALTEFKGYHLIAVRVWAKGAGGDVPTRAGLNVRYESLDELIGALQKAKDAGRSV